MFFLTDGIGRHSKEHVLAEQKIDKGADRVVDRAQIYEEGRWQHQHVHLHGVVQ